MTYQYLAVLLIGVLISSIQASENQPGKSFGAKASEAPHWFKESFLEFEQDVDEAAADGKRVMLYFHQQGCPYCAKLVEENFTDPTTTAYIKKHFDGITINLWGDREVVSVGGQVFTEKTFSAALRVQYTPTLIFLNEKGKVALRLNGYYPPQQFQTALSYVAKHHDENINFATYLAEKLKPSGTSLIDEDFFLKTLRLDELIARANLPLAVYFESADCEECRIMHERILTDKATRKLVEGMNNVQLDIASDKPVTTPGGLITTMTQWARDLNIGYTPAVVFFDTDGVEVMRIDGFMKTFHFQSVYDYVLTHAYKSQPSFQRFISQRAEKIREQGFDTDIWGYESSYH